MSAVNSYLQPVRQTPRLLWLVGVGCCAAAIVVGIQLRLLLLEAGQIKQQVSELQSAPSEQPAPRAEDAVRSEHWSKLQIERRFNWYPLFSALERASDDDIELLDFSPDKLNRHLSLRGEARSMDALVEYLARLSAQPVIGRTYLGYQKVVERGGLKVISFEIKASLQN